MMKISALTTADAFVGAVVLTASIAGAHPVFSQEPISAFASALAGTKSAELNMARHWVLDASHSDETRYRAYRFIVPDTVMVGVAKSITLDAKDHIHIEPEAGAPFVGRANKTHREYSHVLVPVSVTPPTR